MSRQVGANGRSPLLAPWLGLAVLMAAAVAVAVLVRRRRSA